MFYLFLIRCILFLVIFYYVALIGHMFNLWKITDKEITKKAIIPFYYFIY